MGPYTVDIIMIVMNHFQIGMNQVEKPASGYAAPYRGQGTKVTDCVLPTRVQALPKPSHIIQAPWTIEVRLSISTHQHPSSSDCLNHHLILLFIYLQEDKRGSVWYSSLQSLKGTDESAPYPATCVLTLLQVTKQLLRYVHT